MLITETEHMALIAEATDGKYIECSFGPGWVHLNETPNNEWAIQKVRESRKADKENKAT